MDAGLRRERVEWLRTLCDAYRVRIERDGADADDPLAELEMAREVERLEQELRAELPPVTPAPAIDWTDVPL
jgi:hypothetical protein